ncbi:3-isopropylmalate dehydratase small subunit [Pseudomonas sp. LRF_L74]|uniref:3-isopropylmalate dehydratase small subunit n=1 Tax=Pseudomonas sp. LRF_L74 TaxID=3369422 RepID=UPI003F5FA970
MRPIDHHHGLVALLDRDNVDTDAILPKQFMKMITRDGYGPHAFDEWRYLDRGEPGMDCSERPRNPDFELNQPRYQGASILLTRSNFGCGSSREHAVWSLREYGFAVIIGESFADIFRGNCVNNGLLTIPLEAGHIERLAQDVVNTPGYRLSVYLSEQYLETPCGERLHFDIPAADRQRLLAGLDPIGVTLLRQAHIRAFERRQKDRLPWLYE